MKARTLFPAFWLSAAFTIVACGGVKSPEHGHARAASTSSPGSMSSAQDPLGERPAVSPPAAFVPPVPVEYTLPSGLRVWLLERHGLPLVSLQLVVPFGSASDPPGKGGLAWATANMLDEGAGARDALSLARDLDNLGASLHTGATADYAFVSLTSLTKNLGGAASIFGDVVTQPTFRPAEWKRVHDLWQNDLRARKSEPSAIAHVVAQRFVFGEGPYGHPVEGTLGSAARISLDDVKNAYKQAWNREKATLVVVGDVTRASLEPLAETAFSSWKTSAPLPSVPVSKGSGTSPAAPPRAAESKTAPGSSASMVVVVDRPDAPQSVVAIARSSVAAGDPDALLFSRVVTALGGSFTSRLNQELREEHGWSYGAHAGVSFTKGPGLFTAQAAVHTEHTGEALAAMQRNMASMASAGLTPEEFEKTRLIARGERVEAFESTFGASLRLARNAGLGLAFGAEASASARASQASLAEIQNVAARYLGLEHGDGSKSVVVIVGPRAKIASQLAAIGAKSLVTVGPEGE